MTRVEQLRTEIDCGAYDFDTDAVAGAIVVRVVDRRAAIARSERRGRAQAETRVALAVA